MGGICLRFLRLARGPAVILPRVIAQRSGSRASLFEAGCNPNGGDVLWPHPSPHIVISVCAPLVPGGGRLVEHDWSRENPHGPHQDDFALLERAAAELVVAQDPRDLIAHLFAQSRDALGLDVFFNYLMGDDGRLHLAASHGITPEQAREGDTLALGSAVCGIVARERRACHVADVQQSDDPQHAFIRAIGLCSYACHPLMIEDRLIGTLGFGRRNGEPFSPRELGLLRMLTRYVAVAHERLRTEGHIALLERQMRAVLDNATVGIFFVDDLLRCLFMNAAAERLTGYGFEELEGHNLHAALLHTYPDGRIYPQEDCPIARATRSGRSISCEEELIRKDGAFQPIAYTASPMRDADLRIVGTVIEAVDITERRRTEAARALLMREVDHRARNALAVVQSIVQLARADSMSELRQIIIGRVSALGRAQGLLAAARWEGARLTTVIEGEIGAVAEAQAYEIVGAERQIEPEHVQPIGMILHELATNAAKYGALSRPAGHIIVRLEAGALVWEERGGAAPPAGRPPGFGMKMMRQLAHQIGGDISFNWSPGGLVARLNWPDAPPARAPST